MATTPEQSPNKASPRWKMALDVARCIGCHACSVACKVEHNVPLGRFRTKVYYFEQGVFPTVQRHFLPTLCMQCEDAPCLKACKHDAIERGSDGVLRVVPDKCDHAGDCETACPYGAIGCDDNDVADKCDFCSNRTAVGMEPACVETCPAEVFHFGDANDAQSPYSLFMAKHGAETTVLKPEEKTKPSVHYRGHNKAMEAKIPKGRVHDPYSYEIETWTQLEHLFPKSKRVNYAKVVPILEHKVESSPSAKRVAAGDSAKPSPQANARAEGIQPTRTPREGGAA
jgi:tetrathionate reductase subunit B